MTSTSKKWEFNDVKKMKVHNWNQKKDKTKQNQKKWNKNTYIKEKMKNSRIAQPETNKIKWSVDK